MVPVGAEAAESAGPMPDTHASDTGYEGETAGLTADSPAIAAGGGACRSYAASTGIVRGADALGETDLRDTAGLFSGISGGAWFLAQYLYAPAGFDTAADMTELSLDLRGHGTVAAGERLRAGNIFVDRNLWGTPTSVSGSGYVNDTRVTFDLSAAIAGLPFLNGWITIDDPAPGQSFEQPVLLANVRSRGPFSVSGDAGLFGSAARWTLDYDSGLLACTQTSQGAISLYLSSLARSLTTSGILLESFLEDLQTQTVLRGLEGIRLDSIAPSDARVILGASVWPTYQYWLTSCATRVSGQPGVPAMFQYRNDRFSGIAGDMSQACKSPFATETCDGADWMAFPHATVVDAAVAASAYRTYLTRQTQPPVLQLLMNPRQELNAATCGHETSMFLDMADGAFVDTTGILQALQSGATKIVALSMPSDQFNLTAQCNIYPAVKALFGAMNETDYEKCKPESFRQNIQVFPYSDYDEILAGVGPQLDANVPVYARLRTETVENTLYDIEGGRDVDVLFVFLQRSTLWPGFEEGRAMCTGMGGDFPACGMGTSDFMLYPTSVASALADYSAWYVTTPLHADGQDSLCAEFADILFGAQSAARCGSGKPNISPGL